MMEHDRDSLVYCKKCHDHHRMSGHKVEKVEKNQTGNYYPYRDTMESETYYYTRLTLLCPVCGAKIIYEADQNYTMSKTDMEKYGYRGANYGS